MTEERGEIELSAEQKTELLHLGLEATTGGPDDNADMLYDILNRPLPTNSPATNMLPAPLRGLTRKVRSIAGAPIVELLKSSETSISEMEAVKEYAKRSGRSAVSEDLTEVWLSVYYAAIANGLLFHGRKITEHSYQHLSEAFGALAAKDWIQQELSDLMTRAQHWCNEKISQADCLE